MLSEFCHHGMACPWVVDGGDSLQIWRVAICWMSSHRQVSIGPLPAWELSRGLTMPHHKNQHAMKCCTGP